MVSLNRCWLGRLLVVMSIAVAVPLLPETASAQLAPLVGAHYAENSSHPSGGASGYYGTSVPLDLPAVRGNLPIPLQVVYGGRNIGAAGMGWDVPMSYVFRSASIAHQRPKPAAFTAAGATLTPPLRFIVSLGGDRTELVRNAADTAWVGLRNNTMIEVRADGDTGMMMFDGEGRTYRFSSVGATSTARLVHGDLYLLKDISALGNTVHFEYTFGAPRLPTGSTVLSINIANVSYNTNPFMSSTCFKHTIQLNYDALADGAVPLATTTWNGTVVARTSKITSIDVESKATCADSYQVLREYSFSYQADADTLRPQLRSVVLKGRQGTPEHDAPLPVATYSYGSIVDPNTHAITYQDAGTTGPKFMSGAFTYDFGISFTRGIVSTEAHAAQDVLSDLVTDQVLVDFNGDGRPDFYEADTEGLENRPGANGTTTLTDNLGFLLPVRTTPNGDRVYADLIHSTTFDAGLVPHRATGTMNETLRQLIDINGDGRIDIVETVLPDIDHWIIHLNTPDPTDATKTVWVDITVPVANMRAALSTTGKIFGRVPLARKTTVPEGSFYTCWSWFFNFDVGRFGWFPPPDSDHLCLTIPPNNNRSQTITEFGLKDVNGDGYPDFVYNASFVRATPRGETFPTPTDVPADTNDVHRWTGIAADMTDSHNVMVMINTAGSHLKDGVDLFAAPIVLASDNCGVERWQADPSSGSGNLLDQVCGFEDVNGDGLVDRVVSTVQNGQLVTVAHPGTGIPSQPFAPDVAITLPGPLSRTQTDLVLVDAPSRLVQDKRWLPRTCTIGGIIATFDLRRTRALMDINGDGIPDYIIGQVGDVQTDVGAWTVALGTGTDFTPPVTVNSRLGLELSRERSWCENSQQFIGEVAATPTGLYDIDGDGQPEVVNKTATNWEVLQLKPVVGQFSGGTVASAPNAGRLIAIDNQHGAVTHIDYRSAKEDLQSAHLIPSPEIVVSAIATASSSTGQLLESPVRYAYHGAGTLFDPASDAFIFPGYQRTVEALATTTGGSDGTATFRDTYGLEPFDPSMDITGRFRRYLKAGRLMDVTTYAGSGVAGDPWSVTPDASLRISGTHYDWNARVLTTGVTPKPDSNELCIDMMYPYDYGTSLQNQGAAWEDECTKRGFLFQTAVSSWRGTPDAANAFASTKTVQTRTEMRAVDDFGRPTIVALLNEVGANNNDTGDFSKDDLCVQTVYAEPKIPSGGVLNERVRTAPGTRTVTADNCDHVADTSKPVLGQETYEYDTSFNGVKLAAGTVSQGLLTSKIVSRRNAETGATIADTAGGTGGIRAFDIRYDDVNGVVKIASSTREDHATRVLTPTYDDFLLVATTSTISGTNPNSSQLPSLSTTFGIDPVSLDVLSTTEPNGAQTGMCYDGFSRPVLSTITPVDGGGGAMSAIVYRGFEANSAGRSIQQTAFRNAVAVKTDKPCEMNATSLAAASARVATTSMDSLGRSTQTDVQLGADYGGNELIVGRRSFDMLGRVSFEADPYPFAGQVPSVLYGTTYLFNLDGTPSCFIRGNGPQSLTQTTNESAEVYPTCFQQTFSGNRLLVKTQDASSLSSPLSGSPQAGVARFAQYAATGRLINLFTQSATGTLEDADFTADALGNINQMTRFIHIPNGVAAVKTQWHYDKVGQLLELDEPDVAPQFSTYSRWGELQEVSWTDTTVSPSQVHGVFANYDGLGRIVARGERLNDSRPTQYTYVYDQPSNAIAQLTPTNVYGRLARAYGQASDITLSYDGLGRLNARGIFDGNTQTNYIEKHAFNDDGSQKRLEFLLPDTGFKSEHVDYTYDSAGRPLTVRYSDGTVSQDIFTATPGGADIDMLGRIRHAKYGLADYLANYADTGRRLPTDVTVTSPVAAHSRKIAFVADGTPNPFDPMGRERARLEIKNGSTTTPTISFNYDALGRLAFAKRTLAGVPFTNLQYSYDELGNLIQKQDTGTTASNIVMGYETTDRDRICDISYTGGTPSPTCSVLYDVMGNITRLLTPTGTRNMNYDSVGHVTDIVDTATSSHAVFTYDAFGDPHSLVLDSSSSPDTRGELYYGKLLTRRSEVVGGASTTVITRTILGPGVQATRHGTTGTWTFAFNDGRGNRFFTDQTGDFVQDVDYDPYGKPTSTGAQPGAPTYSGKQWNGGDWLSAIGLSRLGARMYDPVLGRFLSRDPLLVPGRSTTRNRYAFANNDPVNFSDPSGMETGPTDSPPECAPGVCDAPTGQPGGAGGTNPGGGCSRNPYDCQRGGGGGGGGNSSPPPPVTGSTNSGGSSKSGGNSTSSPYVNAVYGYGYPYARVVNPEPPGPPLLERYFNQPAAASLTDEFAKIYTGILQLYGIQGPSHATVAADIYPGVHALVAGTTTFVLLATSFGGGEGAVAANGVRDIVGAEAVIADVPNIVQSGNAVLFNGTTVSSQIERAAVRLIDGGAEEINFGGGVHGWFGENGQIGMASKDAAVLVNEDVSMIARLKGQYPNVRFNFYDLSVPAEYDAFVLKQMQATSGGSLCSIAGFCHSSHVWGVDY